VPAPVPSAGRRGDLVAAIATIAACDIALGLTFSLLPLILDARGVPAWLIGANAAMGPLGITCAGPFLPRIVRRFGARLLVFASIAVICVGLACFKLFPSLPAWFVIRFIFGTAAGTLFTVSEAWILSIANAGSRGRIMGLYTSILSITFAVGPLIIPTTGIDGWMPWLIGIACVLVSIVPFAFVTASDAAFRTEEGGGFFAFTKRAPLLLCAVLAVTLVDGIILSFFQIWGLRHGVGLKEISTILGFAIIGNVLVQYPVGLLADRWSRTAVVVLGSIATVILAIGLVWTVDSWALWPVALLLGSTAFVAYTIALTVLGDEFKGPDLIAGSAAISVMWGFGGIAGPPLAGIAVDTFGADAVPIAIATPFAVLLVLITVARGRLVRLPR
jgi:MFS family permease